VPQIRRILSCYTLVAALIVLRLTIGGCVSANAQALPTATQDLRMSVFAGATGTDTGLPGNPSIPTSSTGNNISIMAGYDLGFRTPLHSLHTALEIRGTYPVDSGDVAGEKNLLAGLRIGPYIHKLRPYGDAFYGRGGLNYQGFGYPAPNQPVYYTTSFGNVYGGGGGVDVDLTERFAIKLDAQVLRYSVPVTTSGHLLAKAGTVGVVYRFDFNHRVKLDKMGMPVKK
jgi:hypothetical protein